MGRKILAVIAGLFTGSVVNMALIMLSWAVYPMPEGVDTDDKKAFAEYIQSLPTPALLIVFAAHAGGTLIGAFTAAAIAKTSQFILGLIIGGLFLIAGVINVINLPAPLWFEILDIAAYLPAGYLGARLAMCTQSSS